MTRQLPREAQKPEEALLFIMAPWRPTPGWACGYVHVLADGRCRMLHDAALPLFIETSPGTISVLLVRDSTFHMIAQHREAI